MSDNAVWANRLACLWAEHHLNLPVGSVTSVEYDHDSGGGGCATCDFGSYTVMYAHLREPIPDPEGSIWPVSRLVIRADIGEAVTQMLALATSIIASGEQI